MMQKGRPRFESLPLIVVAALASACEGPARTSVAPPTPEVARTDPEVTATGTPCSSTPLVPQRLWRLSNAQYGNALRDLLGLAQAPSVTGGGQSSFSFYSADTETVSDALAYSYMAAAEAAA